MPNPSNPTPRRDSGETPRRASSASKGVAPTSKGTSPASGGPRGPSRSSGSRTVDMTSARRTASKPSPRSTTDDPGARRRAQKKTRRRQQNLAAWSVAAVVTVMIAGTAAGIWSEYKSTKSKVGQKQATLIDLKAELEIGKKHLQALSSASGKERVLLENGYIKPGERVLLFPKTTPKTTK